MGAPKDHKAVFLEITSNFMIFWRYLLSFEILYQFSDFHHQRDPRGAKFVDFLVDFSQFWNTISILRLSGLGDILEVSSVWKLHIWYILTIFKPKDWLVLWPESAPNRSSGSKSLEIDTISRNRLNHRIWHIF